jgi:ABC-2 type transport system ATP-binding protein
MSIEIKGLTKIYGEQKAIDNLSFKVGQGEIVGFLGPNGAGKSTTMKIITGYLQQDAGEAIVTRIDVRQDPIAAKKKIGYLPESNALYYDMYVREYLGFIAEVHGLPDRRTAIENVITTTGLTPESNKKIGQLSKGYKQRVGLAAALIHDPEVLVLDEPTSGLDPNQIIEIREVIRKQGKNKTVLFSSHILQEVEAICDRVIIINKGKLVANDLLSNLQQASAANVLKVSFKEPLEKEMLSKLKGVKSVNSTDKYSWQLQADDMELVRKQIFDLALQHKLNIVSLQAETQSLEDVFRNLTGTGNVSTQTATVKP